ncbi:NADAR family protein [Paenibacillus daejeonensis]|uniref:NADAR family protein n=1 Tax=Paenibacillus daejeonensis TaxID=135193 RepID=UPI000381453B|nr:NADAR family protein [Paenibacillus daejeonensis]
MNPYNWEQLKTAVSAGRAFQYLMFWGHTPRPDGKLDVSCFSQWWGSEFMVDGKHYSCAEQYMMAEKARLFGDKQAEQAIMEATHPKQMKQLGRSVTPFDSAKWDSHSYAIVKRGTYVKFKQNPDLWEVLKATAGQMLEEASPVDTVWGIGLAQDHPDASNPLHWRGENRLGFALTEVRDHVLEKGWVE